LFLSDRQIKDFDFFNQGYKIVSNTLVLHIAKEFEKGILFENTKDFLGEYIGGYEYPRSSRRRAFWSEEKITLDRETLGIVFGRQKMAADGILVFPGFIHPGFDGRILVNAVSFGPKTFIEKNSEIAYVAFARSNPVEHPFNVGNWYRDSLGICGIE
jgi:hypothetical protein